jgi:hypothetical protein
MVLAQIVINHNLNNNGSYFLLPMVGKCSIKILSISTHGAKQHSFLQLRSDILQMPYSGSPNFIWYVEPQSFKPIDSSNNEYHFPNINVQGKVFISVEELDGTQPDNLDCIITLSVEKINEN